MPASHIPVTVSLCMAAKKKDKRVARAKAPKSKRAVTGSLSEECILASHTKLFNKDTNTELHNLRNLSDIKNLRPRAGAGFIVDIEGKRRNISGAHSVIPIKKDKEARVTHFTQEAWNEFVKAGEYKDISQFLPTEFLMINQWMRALILYQGAQWYVIGYKYPGSAPYVVMTERIED
jgi:hypothetical protein